MTKQIKSTASQAVYGWQRTVQRVVAEYKIPVQWSQAAAEESATFTDSPDDSEMSGRVDLRDLDLLTIDGEDARDFDDAVCCRPHSAGGWQLWVAIADVSTYVKPGSALDTEARRRGTSVYFPQRVIPMLPEVLSNGLCSLNPGVDRLCLVCELRIDEQGTIQEFQFLEAVMRSRARLVYDEVAELLGMDGRRADSQLRDRCAPVFNVLQNLYALYQTLRKARRRRGAIDFHEPEYAFHFDQKGVLESVSRPAANEAYRLIEECMLCANVAAAIFLQKYSLPALFRVHEAPDSEGMEKLRAFLKDCGHSLEGGSEPDAGHFQNVLLEATGRPEYGMVQMMLLRTMKRADYRLQNLGHFGLHYRAYTHFTSPIRRYPDLLAHRVIRSMIHSGRESMHVLRPSGHSTRSAEKSPPPGDLNALGSHCSQTERRAEQAERAARHYLQCSLLPGRIGEEFDAIITGVVRFGLFLQLNEIGVDGMAHVSEIGEGYFQYLPEKMMLRSVKGARSYRLGDSLRVRLLRVDVHGGRIALCPADVVRRPRRGRGRRS